MSAQPVQNVQLKEIPMESLETLCKIAREYNLEHVEILRKYTREELSHIFNGIGPDRFPAVLRELLDTLHPSLLPVALIHDVEYEEGGSEADFKASNDRFLTNGKKMAFAKFSWYDPRRYLVWNKARQFSNLCQLFGLKGWNLK